MVARPWSSSRLSCGERLLLRCDRNTGNSFPTTQGKDPSSRARRRKRGSSGCGRDSRAFSRAETGMSGNFLSCSQGVKDPLEVQGLGVVSLEMPQRKWASCRLEWTETSGGRWECGTTLEFLSPFLWERLLLRCEGNAGNSFPNTQRKDRSSRARRRKRGSSGCGRDSRASSRVETGMSGNFLSCSKGGKIPLEVAEDRCV